MYWPRVSTDRLGVASAPVVWVSRQVARARVMIGLSTVPARIPNSRRVPVRMLFSPTRRPTAVATIRRE